MKSVRFLPYGLLAGLAALSCASHALPPADAQVPVAANSLFGDGAVLQQGVPIPVYGTAPDGEVVTVRLAGHAARATAHGGRWRAALPAMKAGGPYTLSVTGPHNTVTSRNVLIGEVYVCGGQSNMGFNLGSAATGPQVIPQAADPLLHLYQVPDVPAAAPQADAGSQWQAATPQTVPGFSAVAYFFGRDLRKALGVPVGLIETQWGATPAQVWTSADALEKLPDFRPAVETFRTQQKDPSVFLNRVEAWYARHDPGSGGKTWAGPALDDTAWKTLAQPVGWSQSGSAELSAPFTGVVWFRKSVDIPADWAGKDLTLLLGPVDDADTTYFNGVRVGGLNTYQQNRDYTVPGALVKPGRSVIAVRVLNTYGEGGMDGKPEQMALQPTGGSASVPLAGDWLYKVGGPLPGSDPVPAPNGLDPFSTPGVLYNSMIAPLTGFPIRGAIWYQGESNTYDSVQYRTLFPAMIADWRARWGEGDFPFLFVQLAPYMNIVPNPQESAWATLREAQRQTLLSVPRTAMAVITDLGDQRAIHPTRKEPVGGRLALLAEAQVYHRPVEAYGPLYDGMTVQGSKIIVRFTHAAGLHTAAVQDGGGTTVATPGALTGFAVAGADHKYVNADAVIQDGRVVVSSPAVPNPVSVRYGWADYPLVNLYNSAGLPASPFQTDPFPAKTGVSQ